MLIKMMEISDDTQISDGFSYSDFKISSYCIIEANDGEKCLFRIYDKGLGVIRLDPMHTINEPKKFGLSSAKYLINLNTYVLKFYMKYLIQHGCKVKLYNKFEDIDDMEVSLLVIKG